MIYDKELRKAPIDGNVIDIVILGVVKRRPLIKTLPIRFVFVTHNVFLVQHVETQEKL